MLQTDQFWSSEIIASSFLRFRHMRLSHFRRVRGLIPFFLALSLYSPADAQNSQPSFHVLAFYSETVEHDHVAFAHDAIRFYDAAARRNHFDFTATTDWSQLTEEKLREYQVIIWLNDQPHDSRQRAAFEHYMNHGGGWLGFHVAAYNDAD